MESARQLVSVEEYLAAELDSAIKHEYLGGVVYAMSESRNAHSLIAANLIGMLFATLEGSGCRVYTSDTKIRIRMAHQVRFYYPDLSVICRSNPEEDTFQDEPAVVVEIVSDSTRRIDETEKKDAYLTIPSLQAYLLVEQTTPAVVLYQRNDQGFERLVFEGLDATLPLAGLGIELSLATAYAGLRLSRP